MGFIIISLFSYSQYIGTEKNNNIVITSQDYLQYIQTGGSIGSGATDLIDMFDKCT